MKQNTQKLFNAKSFICMVAFCVVISLSSQSFASPQIVCSSPTYNFGSLTNVASVEHTFVLNNIGDEPLQIGKVRACCGASTSLRDKLVEEGSNTTLKVTLSLRGRRGKVNKSIYVASNDPKCSYFRLKLTGNAASTTSPARKTTKSQPKPVITGDILVVPKEICVTGGENRKNPVVRYLALRSRKRVQFKITDAKLPVEGMTRTLTKLGLVGWRIEIANIIPDDKLNGKSITLLTDRKDQPTITIPIRVINR